MKDHLTRLFHFERWANRRVLDSLQQAPDAAAAHQQFAHILGAQQVWLARLRGEDPSIHEVWPEADLSELEARFEALAGELVDYVASLDPTSMNAEISYRTTSGTEFRNSPFDILSHVAMHSQYHRGQVASRLRDAGAVPVPTDFIAYLRLGSG